MTRRLALFSALVAAGLLAACSSPATAPATTTSSATGSENTTSATTDAAPEGEVDLNFAIFSQDQQPAVQQVLDAFEKENSNIKVTLQVIPWTDYWSTLQTTSSGGTGPDVAWMLAAEIGPYLDGGALLPLDDTIKDAGIDVSGYPAELVKLYQSGGATYALPKDFDTIGLWYNKALFDAKGVPYPTADWTWDDVISNAQKLTDPATGTFGIAAPLEAQAGYYNTICQAGGYVISPDGTKSGYDLPASIQGIQFWTDMVNKYKVSPTLASFSDTEAVAQFMSGKIAMMYTGSFYALRFHNDPYASKNFDVQVLPKGPVSNASVINGMGNVAFASSKHPEEAKKLAVFLSSPEASGIYSATGAVLGSYTDTQQAWVNSFPEFHAQVFLDMVNGAVVYPVSKNTDAWASQESQFLTPAWTGTQSVQDAASGLATAMNTALAAEQG
ncbi:MAG: sugar ABC transporter substrate-binding protein [Micrococcales bacterium]|nr:sugar ABC transporter substrate-binding protein [Micrococcales bacterium]